MVEIAAQNLKRGFRKKSNETINPTADVDLHTLRPAMAFTASLKITSLCTMFRFGHEGKGRFSPLTLSWS